MSGAIGKRKVDDDASSGSDDFEAADDSKRREFEKRARQDLNQFLGSKGGDSTRGNLVKIILKTRVEPANPKKAKLSHAAGKAGATYSVSYQLGGADYFSKADVHKALTSGKHGGSTAGNAKISSPKATSSSSSSASSPTVVAAAGGSGGGVTTGSSMKVASTVRKEAHDKAMERVIKVGQQLPGMISGIKVISLGSINPLDAYHSSNQLFPVSYSAEVTIPNQVQYATFLNTLSLDGSGAPKLPQTFSMQIRPGKPSEGPLGPIFRMSNTTTGVTKEGRTEEEVFKAHFPNAPLANEAPVNDALCLGVQPFSFFNLSIELLIEGLKGGLLCNGYRFHAERGYTAPSTSDKKNQSQYTDQQGSNLLKRQFVLAKANKKPAAAPAAAVAEGQASITAAIKRQKVAAAKMTPEEKEDIRQRKEVHESED